MIDYLGIIDLINMQLYLKKLLKTSIDLSNDNKGLAINYNK